jgi:hypothetical protein
LVDFPVFPSLHLELHEGLRGDAHGGFLPDQKPEGNICCEQLGTRSLQILELQAMLVFHQIQVMGENHRHQTLILVMAKNGSTVILWKTWNR